MGTTSLRTASGSKNSVVPERWLDAHVSTFRGGAREPVALPDVVAFRGRNISDALVGGRGISSSCSRPPQQGHSIGSIPRTVSSHSAALRVVLGAGVLAPSSERIEKKGRGLIRLFLGYFWTSAATRTQRIPKLVTFGDLFCPLHTSIRPGTINARSQGFQFAGGLGGIDALVPSGKPSDRPA